MSRYKALQRRVTNLRNSIDQAKADLRRAEQELAAFLESGQDVYITGTTTALLGGGTRHTEAPTRELSSEKAVIIGAFVGLPYNRDTIRVKLSDGSKYELPLLGTEIQTEAEISQPA